MVCLVSSCGVIDLLAACLPRKVLSPNDFTDLDEVAQRLLAFQRRYQQTAVPFDWRLTRADLDGLLHRLGDHHDLPMSA